MNKELWAVLQAKADGEALEKVNSVEQGEGLWAFVRMHQWFYKTTDLGKTNQRIEIMKPKQSKHEREVATAVERWEERCRIMKVEDGEELPEKYRMTALKCILVGDIKRHVELREDELDKYEALRE